MKHLRSLLISTAVIAFGIMLCLERIPLAYAERPLDPTEQLRPFIGNLVSTLTDPDLQGTEKIKSRREKAMKVAEERFDFPEMSKRVLGKTWYGLANEEQEKFVALFTTLLADVYLEKIEGYLKQNVVFKDQRIKGGRALVNTLIVDDEEMLSVRYIMMLKNNNWMIYDVVVEGVSLVRNYMAQFHSILRANGYAFLKKQIEEKIAELAQTSNSPTLM